MSKTIEEELGTHFGRLDKALDGLVKVYEKFIHGISPEQRAATVAHLRAKLATAETRLALAGSAAGGFSFQQPAPGPVYVQPPAQGILNPPGQAPLPPTSMTRPAPALKPIGRIAKSSSDPDAGKVLFAAPIEPARPAGAGDTGVGFLDANDSKDAEIVSL